jgi:hypothetical protein
MDLTDSPKPARCAFHTRSIVYSWTKSLRGKLKNTGNKFLVEVILLVHSNSVVVLRMMDGFHKRSVLI